MFKLISTLVDIVDEVVVTVVDMPGVCCSGTWVGNTGGVRGAGAPIAFVRHRPGIVNLTRTN